jgi:hypothetical protein
MSMPMAKAVDAAYKMRLRRPVPILQSFCSPGFPLPLNGLSLRLFLLHRPAFDSSPGSNQGRSVKCRHVECFDIDEIEDSTCPVCRTVVESADFYVDYQVSRMVSVL